MNMHIRPVDIAFSGFLDKKSPSLMRISWQTRYCVLTINDKCFRYFKQQEDEKEAGIIKLEDVISVKTRDESDSCKIFSIQVQETLRVYEFEAPSFDVMHIWLACIDAVKCGRTMKWPRSLGPPVSGSSAVNSSPNAPVVSTKNSGAAGAGVQSLAQSDTATAAIIPTHKSSNKNDVIPIRPVDIALSGFLDKKSPSLVHISWQTRYCVLTINDKCFRYFKQQEDEKEAGIIKLEDVISVKTRDESDSCKIFSIQVQETLRVYEFEAPSFDVMHIWLACIDAVKCGRTMKWPRSLGPPVSGSSAVNSSPNAPVESMKNSWAAGTGAQNFTQSDTATAAMITLSEFNVPSTPNKESAISMSKLLENANESDLAEAGTFVTCRCVIS